MSRLLDLSAAVAVLAFTALAVHRLSIVFDSGVCWTTC